MYTHRTHRTIAITLLILAVLATHTGCTLPASKATKAAPTSAGLPPAILTEVAGTMQAQLAATQTEIAANAPTAAPTTKVKAKTSPTRRPATAAALAELATSTFTLTPTSTATRTPTFTPTKTPTATPTRPTFTPTQTLRPTATRRISPGTHFIVDYVHIPAQCYGENWVFFAIFNNGGSTLQSLSLVVFDRTSGSELYKVKMDNTPFLPVDNLCDPSQIDGLSTGDVLYIGAPLGYEHISKHELLATITLCNGEILTGTCHTRKIEFKVP